MYEKRKREEGMDRFCQNSGPRGKSFQKVGNASFKTSAVWGKDRWRGAFLEATWGMLSPLF
jgi:hypothetical protein